MKKFMAIIFMAFSLILVGCEYKYSGDYPQLYTVAINSLLWNHGLSTATDRFIDPTIDIIQKDQYGRILFQYTEKSFTPSVAFSSLIIMQYSTQEDVYYYEDVNFISKEKVSHSHVQVEFDLTEIESLKEINDWNKDLNLDKCISKEISRTKAKPQIDENTLKEMFEENGYYNDSTFLLSTDDYGRFICYSCVSTINNGVLEDQYLVILFQNDLTYAVFSPKSFYNYQEELKEFKAKNNWNCQTA
ncbi:MAG: hypothetical protein E7667_07015 [Ruminococcaceae bacterium]|nr:hypothetical protein [Oscillospiraceae bacterium]